MEEETGKRTTITVVILSSIQLHLSIISGRTAILNYVSPLTEYCRVLKLFIHYELYHSS